MRTRRTQRGYWWVPLAAAAVSAIGNKMGQDSANEQNVQLSQENRDFQERMSNTQYQRAVTDMQAAGLNPMLAYSQGGAGGAPGGAARVENALGGAVSSAAAGAQAAAAVKMNEEQMELVKAQKEKIVSETIDQSINSARATVALENEKLDTLRRHEDVLVQRHTAARLGYQLRAEMDDGSEGPQVQGSGFAADVRNRKAEAEHRQLGLTEARQMQKFWDKTGELNPYIRQLFELFRVFTSAKGALR